MRRFASRVMFVSALLVVGGAFARDASADDMWDKGGRGLANIVTSPYEVIRQGKLGYDKKGGVGIFSGSLRGIGSMVGRIGVGAYELATFPLPGYDTILEPEFIIPSTPRAHADWGEDQVTHVY